MIPFSEYIYINNSKPARMLEYKQVQKKRTLSIVKSIVNT